MGNMLNNIGLKDVLETTTTDEIKKFIVAEFANPVFDLNAVYEEYTSLPGGIIFELEKLFWDSRNEEVYNKYGGEEYSKNDYLNNDLDLQLFLAIKISEFRKSLIEVNPKLRVPNNMKDIELEKMRLHSWDMMKKIIQEEQMLDRYREKGRLGLAATSESLLENMNEEHDEYLSLYEQFMKSEYDTLEEYQNSLKEESSMGHR